MGKATEKKLSDLHGAVAEVLTNQILHQQEDTVFDADGNEVGTGEMRFTASPATMAAAIKFLKDNQITCDVEVDTNTSKLREALANKQRHSRLTEAGVAALKVV